MHTINLSACMWKGQVLTRVMRGAGRVQTEFTRTMGMDQCNRSLCVYAILQHSGAGVRWGFPHTPKIGSLDV